MQPFFLLVLAASALAVAPGPTARAQAPADGGPAPGLAPTETPLDGGASLLVVGGVAYACRRLRRRANTEVFTEPDKAGC